MPSKTKLQIALEFMIIFSFVLLVFTVLFAVISTQRTQTTNSQIYSQEQLVAQNIAAQLDRALQAGNGYSASVPLSGMIGSLNYQVLITMNGAVIVNVTVGKQKMQAIAYSTVKNVVSNPTYSQNGLLSYYKLPISNGTIAIQNAFGTICVDYQCPSTLGQARNVSLAAQIVHAANFNGQSSYLLGGSGGGDPLHISGGSAMSVVAWIKPSSLSGTQQIVGENGPFLLDLSGSNLGWSFLIYTGTWTGTTGATNLVAGRLYQVAMTYDGANIRLYVNGFQDGFIGKTGNLAGAGSLLFGTYSTGGATPTANWFNGLISNVQIYSGALSSNQIQQLYSGGISSAPLSGNLVGWWPLNGNANDYSGNGNNANANGLVLFTTTAQLSAYVTTQNGQPAAHSLVGFTTTLGNFTTSSSYSNYTNANGIAVAFLNQQGTNGKALVTAIAYNGNLSVQGNLIGWWPLRQNFSQSQTVYDISGNGNNGILVNYAPPPSPIPNINNNLLVAQFNGASSYVSIPSAAAITGKTSFTKSAWVYLPSGITSGYFKEDIFCWGNYGSTDQVNCLRTGDSANQIVNYFWNDDLIWTSTHFVNGWNFIAVTYNGVQEYGYVNGVQEAAYSTTNANVVSTSPMIGKGYSGDNLFNGKLSNVQLYNATLSPTQLQQQYLGGISALPIPGSGLVGWWPLNGNLNDYGGKANAGVGTNVVYASQRSLLIANMSLSGYGVNFNSINDYIAANVPQVSSNAGGYNTASFWMYWNGNVNWNGNVDGLPFAFTDGTSIKQSLWFPTASCFGFNTANSDAYGISPAALQSRWVFVTAEFYNGAYTGNSRLYINGIQQPLSQCYGSANSGTANSHIYIGGTPLGGGYYFNGTIADFRLYSGALSQQQVLNLYLSQTPPNAATPIGMSWIP